MIASTKRQEVKDNYAVYNMDCIEGISQLPDNSVDMFLYSPPFHDLYAYSSKDEDMGNAKDYYEFLEHYEFLIRECYRVLKPGRIAAIHCMDIPIPNYDLIDFAGDIIRLHKKNGFYFNDKKTIWKEPLMTAIRSRSRQLMHCQLVDDSSVVRSALADYVIMMRKQGTNQVKIKHDNGLKSFIGQFRFKEEKDLYDKLFREYKNYDGDQSGNKLSHFIWRRYASCHWGDINAGRMVDYLGGKEKDDDRHVCPLQLDVIERLILLYSNKREIILTPFGGVGSELVGSINMDRIAIGFELKESYFKQAIRNCSIASNSDIYKFNDSVLFTGIYDEMPDDYVEVE